MSSDQTNIVNLYPFNGKHILTKGSQLFSLKEIDGDCLPRNVDILSYIYFLKNCDGVYHKKLESFYAQVIKKVVQIWEKTGIPIISETPVRKKLNGLLKKYMDLKVKIHKGSCDAEGNLFFLCNLFNISKCKCESAINLKSETDAHNYQCECSNRKNLSEYQYMFYKDQISERLLKIGIYFQNVVDKDEAGPPTICSDIPTATTIETSMYRLSVSPPSAASSPSAIASLSTTTKTSASPSSFEEDENFKSDSDTEYVLEPADATKMIPDSIKLPKTVEEYNFNGICMVGMQYNTSVRQLSAIVNRTLEMVGAITEREKGLVITPSHIQNKICKLGLNVSTQHMKENFNRKILCFFFDGFTTKNLTKKYEKGAMIIDRSTKFENIVVVEQPYNRYIGFIASTQSNADTIFLALDNFFTSSDIDLSTLIAIGCDGASTNVGRSNGIITKFEQHLQRPLHRIICLLHLIELILKAVITFFMGKTKAPNQFANKINEDLSNCEKKKIVKFTPIKLENMPPSINNQQFDSSLVTKDQKTLLDFSRAISSGIFSDDLARRQLGDLSEVRWTLYGCRFLRLYASCATPTLALRQIVMFIQKVYVPVFFWIKCHPNWTNGARHLHRILSFSRALPLSIFKIIKERILHNGHFLHSENILLSMITDNDETIRRRAYQIILSLRHRNMNKNVLHHPVRTFSKPSTICFKHPDEAAEEVEVVGNGDDDYSNLFNWSDVGSIHEPPFTKSLSEEELTFYKDNIYDIIDVPPLPVHSQATEFYVQVVKGVVTKYAGQKTQEERIQSKILSRSLNQDFRRTCRKLDYEIYE